MRSLALALCLIAPAALSQDRAMTGADFQALAEGWTLHFEDELGEYFGSEQYLENGSTVWLPREGRCQPGFWEENAGRICFYYASGSACWRLYQEGPDEISAVAADDQQSQPPLRLRLIRRDKGGLICPEEPGV